MTVEEEERFIAEQLESARWRVEVAEKEERAAKFKVVQAKAELDVVKQAALDYMKGNGLKECEAFYLKPTYRVDVENIEAVPEEYIRKKVTQEVNKDKIRKERPVGNWYIMKEFESVVVR